MSSFMKKTKKILRSFRPEEGEEQRAGEEPVGEPEEKPEREETTASAPQTGVSGEQPMGGRFSNLNTADVMGYAVEGMKFPTTRDGLIEHARNNGAPDNVIAALQQFPERTYHTLTDVAHQTKLTVEELHLRG